MKLNHIAFASVILLSGCTSLFPAQMVQTSDDAGGQVSKRWGVVSFINQGWPGAVEARKKQAREKMQAYCGSANYNVVDASDRNQTTGGMGQLESGGGFGYSTFQQQTVRWKFECAD
jgi:hypothetical protein